VRLGIGSLVQRFALKGLFTADAIHLILEDRLSGVHAVSLGV
jgi:hypothetical protein